MLVYAMYYTLCVVVPVPFLVLYTKCGYDEIKHVKDKMKQLQSDYYNEPDKTCCICKLGPEEESTEEESTSNSNELGELLAYAHEGNVCCSARVHFDCWNTVQNLKLREGNVKCPTCIRKLEKGSSKNVFFQIIIPEHKRNELQKRCSFEADGKVPYFKARGMYNPPETREVNSGDYIVKGDDIVGVEGKGLKWLRREQHRELIFGNSPDPESKCVVGCFGRSKRAAPQAQPQPIKLNIRRKIVFSKLHTEAEAEEKRREILTKKGEAKLKEYRKEKSKTIAKVSKAVGITLLVPYMYFGFYPYWIAIFTAAAITAMYFFVIKKVVRNDAKYLRRGKLW